MRPLEPAARRCEPAVAAALSPSALAAARGWKAQVRRPDLEVRVLLNDADALVVLRQSPPPPAPRSNPVWAKLLVRGRHQGTMTPAPHFWAAYPVLTLAEQMA